MFKVRARSFHHDTTFRIYNERNRYVASAAVTSAVVGATPPRRISRVVPLAELQEVVERAQSGDLREMLNAMELGEARRFTLREPAAAPWMREALKSGWTPPCKDTNRWLIKLADDLYVSCLHINEEDDDDDDDEDFDDEDDDLDEYDRGPRKKL